MPGSNCCDLIFLSFIVVVYFFCLSKDVIMHTGEESFFFAQVKHVAEVFPNKCFSVFPTRNRRSVLLQKMLVNGIY